MLRVTQGSSWEMTRCLLGARDGPGPHQASVLSASIGLGDPSPLQNGGNPASGSMVLWFACQAGSQWMFSTQEAFVLTAALLALFKTGPFPAGQWLRSRFSSLALTMGCHNGGNPEEGRKPGPLLRLCLSLLFLNPLCLLKPVSIVRYYRGQDQ